MIYSLNQSDFAWHSLVCAEKKVPDAQGTQLPSLISTKPGGQRNAFSTWKALEGMIMIRYMGVKFCTPNQVVHLAEFVPVRRGHLRVPRHG